MSTHKDNLGTDDTSKSSSPASKDQNLKATSSQDKNSDKASDKKKLEHLKNPEKLQDDKHKMNKRLNDVEGEVTYDQESTKKDNKKDDDDKGTE